MKKENEKTLAFLMDAKEFLEYKRLCVSENKTIKQYTTELIRAEMKRKKNAQEG